VTLHVELVSPERILFSGDAGMVICRTIGGGEIAFLSGHTPFLGALDDAPVRIRTTEGNWEDAAVHGGFVHVRDDNVIVLSDLAELASQIDFERARRDQEELERKVMDTDDAEVEARLRRVHVRLAVKELVGA
jgi:F-type H+-transporting ATPase subunit epsilon